MPASVEASAGVSFSEINWAGSIVSNADEWLELANTSAEVIDLSGWKIIDLVKNDVLIDIDSGQIAPKGYFLIGNNLPDQQFSKGQSTLEVLPDIVSSKLSLSNSKFKLGLLDSLGQLIDVVGDGADPETGSQSEFRSMEKNEGIWANSELSINLRSGFGSPTNSKRPILGEKTCRIIFQDGSFNLDWPVSYDEDNPISRLFINDISRDFTLYSNLLNVRFPQNFDIYNQEWEIRVVAKNGLSDTRTLNCKIAQMSKNLRLSEVLPNPIRGQSEFVELFNSGDALIPLTGWQLDDELAHGSSPMSLDGFEIAPKSQLVIYLKKLRLNNSGDSVNLIDPAGEILDTVDFSQARQNMSWSLIGESWGWSPPSAGKKNLPHEELKTVVGKSFNDSDLASVLKSNDFKSIYRLRLLVSEPLGTYSNQMLIVADAGSFAEFKAKNLSLKKGDVIVACVKKSKSKNPRLNQQGNCPLSIVDRDQVLPISLGEESVKLFERLELKGKVFTENRRTWLRTESNIWQVTKKSGLSLPKLVAGMEVRIGGIVVNLDPLGLRIIDNDSLEVINDTAELPLKSDVDLASELTLSTKQIEDQKVDLSSLYNLIDDMSELQSQTNNFGARVLGKKVTVESGSSGLKALVIISSLLTIVLIGEIIWEKLRIKQKIWQI